MRIFALALFAFGICASAPAMAESVFVTQSLHLRAGPDKDYPIVSTLQSGERVELLGCIERHDWCEVETSYEERGWVSARYLQTSSGGKSITIIETTPGVGTHIVVFKQQDYWDRYYRNKYFYKNKDKWHEHKPDRPDKPDKPPVIVEKPQPQYKKMETPSRKGYNPLCRMGEKDC